MGREEEEGVHAWEQAHIRWEGAEFLYGNAVALLGLHVRRGEAPVRSATALVADIPEGIETEGGTGKGGAGEGEGRTEQDHGGSWRG